MIQIIPFSFNRAMQLDTLLSTLIEHWKTPMYQIDVIYNYSSPNFGDGYKILEEKFANNHVVLHRENNRDPDRITFGNWSNIYNFVRLCRSDKLRRPKTNFRSLMIDVLEKSDAENVMFLTDDAMFVSDVFIPQDDLNWINDKPRDRQFSLRLGKGVKELPPKVTANGDYCSWNFYENHGHWGYVFSVDAHIYNKSYLLELLRKYIFNNPSTFEGFILGNVNRSKALSQGRCFADIKMLSFPINIVQNIVDNYSQNVSVEMLNEKYLKGETMRYVYESNYNADKLYVKQLQFTDSEGKVSLLNISNEKMRLNAAK